MPPPSSDLPVLDFQSAGLRLRVALPPGGGPRLVGFGPDASVFPAPEACSSHYAFHLQGEQAKYRYTANMGMKHHFSLPGKDLAYVSHEVRDTATALHIDWRLEGEGLEVVLHWRLFKDAPVLRATLEVANRGTSPQCLEAVAPLMLHGLNAHRQDLGWEDFLLHLPHNSWCSEAQWRAETLAGRGLSWARAQSSHRIVGSNTGTWSTKELLPMAVLEDRAHGLTWAWQVENNGSWAWELSDMDHDLYLTLGLLNEERHHWSRILQPGESFLSLPVAATCVFGGFDEALGALTRYRRAMRRPHPDCDAMPVIFNDYMNALFANPTTEKERPLIAAAAEAGCEFYVIDAGWYAPLEKGWWSSIGEWLPCQERFEGGLDGILGEIRAAGMVPGLWLELESLGVDCPLAATWPADCFFQRHGKVLAHKNRLQLDFRHPVVRAHADEVLDRLVGGHGVGYIKMDYNIEAGIGTDVDADSPGDGLLQHNRAYLDWLEKVLDRHPSLIIENCGSGGLRMDYALLRLHSIQSSSDQEDALLTARIAAAAATAGPPEQIAVWSYPLPGDSREKIVLNLVNSLLARMHLGGRPDLLDAAGRVLVAEAITLYKSRRAFLRQALPFWPLGLPKPGDTVYAAGLRHGDESLLAVWNLGGGTVDLHDILPDAGEYRICFPASAAGSWHLPPGPSARILHRP
jgi:alpha-galactosidase